MLLVILSEAKNLLLKGRWALILTGLVVSGIFVLTCRRSASAPLPQPVSQLIERHAVESQVDTPQIHRLKKAAASDSAQKVRAVAQAQVAAESGDYHAAYAAEDTALTQVEREAALLDLALTKSESRADQGDSVIAAVLPLVEAREAPCRILGFIPCPTRRAVAAAAAAVPAVAFIQIPKLVKP